MVSRLVALALVVAAMAAGIHRAAPAQGALHEVLTPRLWRDVFALKGELVHTSAAQPAFLFTRQAAGSSAARAGVTTG